jgi:hypothetical protein
MSKEDRAREDRVRDFEEHDLDRAQAFVDSRAELAEKIFSQAINSLWLGNSGAALATLSFIGAAWKDGGFPRALLWPLGFFILGVISMGVGTLVALLRERGVVERNQKAQSLLDIFTRDVQSPLERVGLSRGDWRMRLALCSGVCFVVGCVVGFILLARTAAS